MTADEKAAPAARKRSHQGRASLHWISWMIPSPWIASRPAAGMFDVSVVLDVPGIPDM
jgi:hypothetical protein